MKKFSMIMFVISCLCVVMDTIVFIVFHNPFEILIILMNVLTAIMMKLQYDEIVSYERRKNAVKINNKGL